jgi:hypothetical protein
MRRRCDRTGRGAAHSAESDIETRQVPVNLRSFIEPSLIIFFFFFASLPASSHIVSKAFVYLTFSSRSREGSMIEGRPNHKMFLFVSLFLFLPLHCQSIVTSNIHIFHLFLTQSRVKGRTRAGAESRPAAKTFTFHSSRL